MMNDGVILIDKPTGMTSFGVVARIRRILSKEIGKRAKVGHTGTLDPFATGLMIIVTGKECRNAMSYSKLDKSYRAVMKLGETSTTGDPEGELSPMSDIQPTREDVLEAARGFVGQIEQVPPAYSAIKVDGQRAYKLARKGEIVEIPPRQVTIYELEVEEYEHPYVTVRAHVSSGTYIRTLVEDIGKKLGTGAYTTELRRLTVGEWSVDDAKTLADFGIKD